MSKKGWLALCVLWAFLLSGIYSAHATNVQAGTRCMVVKVIDGDTFKCAVDRGSKEKKNQQNEKELVKVRVKGMDAPELKQKYGKDAKFALEKTLGGTGGVVVLNNVGRDKYGRITADVVNSGGKNVAYEMVRNGHGWAYKEKGNSPYASELLKVEEMARKEKLGLWKTANPKPPWEWRKEHK